MEHNFRVVFDKMTEVFIITCGIYTPTQTKFYIPLRDVQNTAQDGKIKSDK
jgi:hypothetical protein